MIVPLVWMIAQSLSGPSEAFTSPPRWLPTHPTLENFGEVFQLMPFGRQFLNSVILATGITLGSLFFSALAAYAFSRISFTGSRLMFVTILSALMVPPQLLIIPLFVMMQQAGLVDTLWAIGLPALINVFQVFLLTQYFNSIPREMDEAAILDGANHRWILFKMILSLSGPALTALAILSFEMQWNSYFAPLIFLYSPENMTLPLGLVVLQTGIGAAPAAVVFAAVTMAVLPVLVLFILFQKQFVASVATSGLKG